MSDDIDWGALLVGALGFVGILGASILFKPQQPQHNNNYSMPPPPMKKPCGCTGGKK